MVRLEIEFPSDWSAEEGVIFDLIPIAYEMKMCGCEVTLEKKIGEDGEWEGQKLDFEDFEETQGSLWFRLKSTRYAMLFYKRERKAQRRKIAIAGGGNDGE